MIQADLHTHSVSSGHATTDTIIDMVKAARDKGLPILGISDHGPATVGSCSASYFRSLPSAPRFRMGVELWYGAEANILDYRGCLDLDDSILTALDYTIISMHSANCKPGTIIENTTAYIKAMSNPHVKIIGHCDDESFPIDYDLLVRAAREYHVLPEINNASLLPDIYRGNTLPNIMSLLNFCLKYNQPVILSSDSHGKEHIQEVGLAEALLQEVGFPRELVLNYDAERLREYIFHPA